MQILRIKNLIFNILSLFVFLFVMFFHHKVCVC